MSGGDRVRDPLGEAAVFSQKVRAIGLTAAMLVGFMIYMWSIATRPIMQSIADERRARVAADSTMRVEFLAAEQDRTDRMSILVAALRRQRAGKIAEIVQRWSRGHPP